MRYKLEFDLSEEELLSLVNLVASDKKLFSKVIREAATGLYHTADTTAIKRSVLLPGKDDDYEDDFYGH
jgi:hypothetical protein